MSSFVFPREDRALQRCLGSGHRIAATAALLLVVVALLAGPRTAAGEAPGSHQFIASVNEARASHGLRPLRVARSLQRSSDDYANWMLDHERFAHLASIRAPHRFGLRGEVLAVTPEDHPNAAEIASKWLGSRSHRQVLLDRRYRFIGVGVAHGWLNDEPVTVVTGHFGGRVKRR